MSEIGAAPSGVVVGVLDTAGVDDRGGGSRIVSIQLLDDTGAAAPAQWMTPGQSYTLHFDGTGWAVAGGWIARTAVYRLARGGRYVTTLPTLHGDEPLDADRQYALASIVAEEPTWQLRREPLQAELDFGTSPELDRALDISESLIGLLKHPGQPANEQFDHE